LKSAEKENQDLYLVSIWPIANLDRYNPQSSAKPFVLNTEIALHRLPEFIYKKHRDNFSRQPTTIHLFVPRDLLGHNLDMQPFGRTNKVLGSEYPLVTRTNLSVHPIPIGFYNNLQQKWQKIEEIFLDQYTRNIFEYIDCECLDLFDCNKMQELVEKIENNNALIIQKCSSLEDLFDWIVEEEYISLPMTNVWHQHESIDLDVASIFDPFGNAVHSALSFPVLGEDVLITGAGPIGVMCAAIAKHAGARYVVVTDINPFRLELAKKMGATRVVDVSKESLTDVQKELGMQEGFDVGLEMSGNPQAFRQMLENMSHGGKISMLGIPPGGEMAIDWNLVIFNMLTIKGIYGREMYETWYKMTVMVQGGLDITPVITHRLTAEEFEIGFAAMKSGDAGKVILKW
jgi:hypothetical protein